MSVKDINILLIEDEIADILLFKKIIRSNDIKEEFNVKLIITESFDDVKCVLDKRSVDLIFLDQQLKEFSGVDVLQYIRDYFSEDLPVIIYSNCDLDEFKVKCMELKASDFQAKYLKPKMLLEVINRHYKDTENLNFKEG